MEYFLEKIARSLHNEFGNSLNRHCLVFPNRRAGLYLLKYLAVGIEKPIWVPAIFTVNDLFKSYSSLQMAGNEILLFELYKIYRVLKKSPESFDDFYFWGDMLLNDFDDVDKYLVDASLLFSNIKDIKQIDQQFGALTELQIEVIRRFWLNFNPDKPTDEKSGFKDIWSLLYDLYSGFRKSLKEQNLAYEGMIFRDIAEDGGSDIFSGVSWEMLHFIGFNALNECEKTLMIKLKKSGKARFYWDYDNSYIEEAKFNSAGLFMQGNLKIFGNDMPSDWSYNTMLSAEASLVHRRVIDTSSDVAQVKLISRLIEDLPGLTSENAHHTAVVLADENLLMPVLTSLPENVGAINITMGHPLKQTLVYTLVRHMMDLQRTSIKVDGNILFNYIDVLNILRHSMVSQLLTDSENELTYLIVKNNLIWIPSDRFKNKGSLSRIFIKPSTPAMLSVYFKEILSLMAEENEDTVEMIDGNNMQRSIINEFIYRVILSINRLEAVVNSSEVSFTTETYIGILDRMLRMQSVPFSGEPLSGIQIMGILETRTLDFKNLIILSVNEGVLPAVSTGSSFIPLSLREAFGLPSVNHQESIYAYHFYRLLQRAENVTLIYNSNSEGLRSGEMSRFLIQMKYEPALKPEFIDLNFEIKSHKVLLETIERDEEHSRLLNSQFLDRSKGRILSPSAINTWLQCRMKFYYRYVNGLKEPDKVSTDIDPAMLGNILHEIMKRLYMAYIGKVLTDSVLDSLLRDRQLLYLMIKDVIGEKFNSLEDKIIGGNELLIRDVLMEYLIRILKEDKSHVPITLLHLEDSFSTVLSVLSNGEQIELSTGGKIDRVDIAGGVTRVVDYKTGTVAESINAIEELFTDDRKKDQDGWLQTLLYCEIYLAGNQGCIIRPSIYKIKKLGIGSTNEKMILKTESRSIIEVDDYQTIRDEFVTGLKGLISTIFSNNEPFTMTSDIRGKCAYCAYRGLCMR